MTTPLAIAPMPAAGLCCGVSASGITEPLNLPSSGTVTLFCAVTGLTSGAGITVSLQQEGGSGWEPILTLPSQSSTGVQQASVQVQQPGPLALAWTLTGTSPIVDIAAFAVAAG